MMRKRWRRKKGRNVRQVEAGKSRHWNRNQDLDLDWAYSLYAVILYSAGIRIRVWSIEYGLTGNGVTMSALSFPLLFSFLPSHSFIPSFILSFIHSSTWYPHWIRVHVRIRSVVRIHNVQVRRITVRNMSFITPQHLQLTPRNIEHVSYKLHAVSHNII